MSVNRGIDEKSEFGLQGDESIVEISNGLYEDPDYEIDYRVTFTRRTTALSIIAIHISCFCSRAMLEASDAHIFEIINMISWLAYSLFVPGLVILLYHRKGSLASVDLILLIPISLMWVQLIGPLTQLIFTLLRITDPIQWYTTGTFSLFLTASIFYRYSFRYYNSFAIDVPSSKVDNSVVIFCLVMLSSSIFGPLIFSESQNNIASMLALLICSLAAFRLKSGKSAQMLVLYCTALSVLFISSLASPQVSGMDIQVEFFFANSVIERGSIDLTNSGHYSTVLSTQGIIPLITIWSGISLEYVLKVIYPMIFAYCSILLYASYIRLFSYDVAFYSTLFTIFSVSFYTSMLDVVRQGLAEIFLLSAIFLLCHSDDVRAYRNRVFIIPMLGSMTLAHYGINYVIYPMLWISYFIFLYTSSKKRSSDIQIGDENRALDYGQENEEILEGEEIIFGNDVLLDEENLFTFELLQTKVRDYNPILNLPHLFTGSFLVILWHSVSGGGEVISTILQYVDTLGTIYRESGILGAFSRTQPTQSIAAKISLLREITQILYMFLMIISVPSIFLKYKDKNNEQAFLNFISITIACWLVFVVVFTVPNIAVRLNFPRVFHLLAMYTAPFSFMTIISIQEFTDRVSFSFDYKQKRMAISSFLSILFLLSSGFAYQLSDEDHRMYVDPDVDWARFSESEVAASQWQKDFAQDEVNGFPCKAADYYRSALSRKFIVEPPGQSKEDIFNSKYVLVSGFNLENYHLFISTTDLENEYAIQGYSNFSIIFEDGSLTRSRIYDSGEANWFFMPNCYRNVVVSSLD